VIAEAAMQCEADDYATWLREEYVPIAGGWMY
jgi:hypothetical protein